MIIFSGLKKRTEVETFEWQVLKTKNVPDVLVDLEEAFFNDLMRAYITETSPYKSYTRYPPYI